MSRNQTLVSVVVPAFNAAPYVAGALTSVLNQTYPELEVIVVDDASRDRTPEVVKSFSDKRITLIRHERNRGPGAARNTGVAAAQGRWIAFLDADDQMQSDRISRLVEAITLAGPGFFVADDEWECLDQPGTLVGVRRHLAAFKLSFRGRSYLDLELPAYLRAGCPHLHGLVPADAVKSNAIRFPVDSFVGEDLEFYCRLFLSGLKLRLLAKPGYMYRLTPSSISRDLARLRDIARVYKRLATDSRLGYKERQYFLMRERQLGMAEGLLRLVSLVRARRWGDGLAFACSRPVLFLEVLRRLPNVIRHRW